MPYILIRPIYFIRLVLLFRMEVFRSPADLGLRSRHGFVAIGSAKIRGSHLDRGYL